MTVPPPLPPPDPPSNGEYPARRAPEPTDSEVDASFTALIAGWGDSPPPWPDTPSVRVAPPEPSLEHTATEPEQEDEGHYERPEVPPVPAPHRATVGALVLIALGLFLVLAPGVIGLAATTGFALGLTSITGGLAWLLSRLRPGPPTDSGWDDGAQV